MNHYEALGIEPGASADDIKHAYRKAAGRYHPDRGGSAEDMQRVNAANDCLSDPERRAAYDASGYADGAGARKKADLAAAVLVDAFNAAISSGRHDGVVAVVTHTLQKMIAAAQAEKATLLQRARHLERQLKRVRVRKGENLYEMLVQERIAALKRQAGQEEETIARYDDALGLLKNYEDVEEPKTARQVNNDRLLFVRHPFDPNDELRQILGL